MSVATDKNRKPGLKNCTVNLRDLTILVADPGSHMRRLVYGILRGFGANRILEVSDASGVQAALTHQKIDILICDSKLPPQGGLAVATAIRRNAADESRTIPIMIMTSDTQQATVKLCRDAGASMVVAKPISPSTLYDRLVWIAFDRRQFIDCPTYFGPDRRFKIESYPKGAGRRASDKAVASAAVSELGLDQGDSESLLLPARAGHPND